MHSVGKHFEKGQSWAPLYSPSAAGPVEWPGEHPQEAVEGDLLSHTQIMHRRRPARIAFL